MYRKHSIQTYTHTHTIHYIISLILLFDSMFEIDHLEYIVDVSANIKGRIFSKRSIKTESNALWWGY